MRRLDLIVLASVLVSGCQTSAEAVLKEPPRLPWSEIEVDQAVHETAGREIFNARILGTAELPHASSKHVQPDTSRLLSLIEEPMLYEKGVLAKLGTAKIFLAHRDKVPDDTRLFWVMVKTLSEKYGCFMRQKLSLEDRIETTCKDGRRIVFWPSKTAKVVQFVSRQFDQEGFEIIVRKRRIVRVGQTTQL